MSGKNGLAQSGRLSLTDSHEDRLQKVESTLNKVAIDVAKIEINQNHITKALDAQAKALDAQTDTLIKKLDEVNTKVGTFEIRMVPLEQYVAAAKTRSEHLKSIAKAAVIAMVGAIATGIGAKLFEMWSTK